MKPFNIISVAVFLLAVSSAHENSIDSKVMRPLAMEQIPSLEEISIKKLESMPAEKGTEMVEKIYHLSQIYHNIKPNHVPSPSSTPVYLYKPNGQKVMTTLDKIATASKQLPDLGRKEVTVFITGLPETTESVRKANKKLVEAYLERYSAKKRETEKDSRSAEKSLRSSSEEDSREWKKEEHKGHIVVIDLGSKINSLKEIAALDTERTGAMIASALSEMAEKHNVANEAIHIVAQGIAAHVAGAVGYEHNRRTGRKLRRISALDPSKLYAKNPNSLQGLKRGDAELVDAIHTNSYGLGTVHDVGDVDFYPNGPSGKVPGAKNIVEASMRATRYFAETVIPGSEHNFPAIAAKSLNDYSNNNGNGKRVYMGLDTDYDAKGDYILEVKERSSFGKRAPKSRKPYRDNE